MIKKLVFIAGLMISINAWAEATEECRKKDFIDLWDTICPDDWNAFPSNDETKGRYFAPRSRIQIPKEATKAEDIELVVFWMWEYDERGLFGTDIKAIWSNYYIQCNNNRYFIQDLHGFSDITAKNKIFRDTAKNYDNEWLPITFEESAGKKMNTYVLAACNLI